MARPRLFSEEEVIAKAAKTFAVRGYNATSIDDLLAATGLQRGSLYKAFGSKLNLFTMCFDKYVTQANWQVSEIGIDLMIVALREVVSEDRVIRKKCSVEFAALSKSKAAVLIGSRLIQKVETK